MDAIDNQSLIVSDIYASQERSATEISDVVGGKLLDDVTTRWLNLVLLVITLGTITFLGSTANVINIMVFVRQGFSDTMNISLLGLALSDLGGLLTLLWMSICFNPLFQYSDIPFESTQVMYHTAGWPHVCFARITCWITAFITFERCLCIALPMKVKNIITANRTIGIVVTIYIVMILAVTPIFCAVRLGPAFHVERNKTLIGLIYVENGQSIENVASSANGFFQLVSFVIIVVCTAILIRNLTEKSKWRRAATNASVSGSGDAMSSRDKRIVKMVIFIAGIFILCFLPSAVNLLCMIIFAEQYSIFGVNVNMFKFVWSILFNLEATNSAVNIFIYYKMSSKYRAEFLAMFSKNPPNDGRAAK